MIEEIPGDLLQWLKGFYYVAEKGSVTQATIVMGREQPSITRQIKCLGKELGVTLFDRSSGKMKLRERSSSKRPSLYLRTSRRFELSSKYRSSARERLLSPQATRSSIRSCRPTWLHSSDSDRVIRPCFRMG